MDYPHPLVTLKRKTDDLSLKLSRLPASEPAPPRLP
jgi:hypothetical protein